MSADHPPSPRLVVTDFALRPEDQARLREALGEDRLLVVSGRDALRETLRAHPEADVVCTFSPTDDLLDIAPSLRWLALPSAGADRAVGLSWFGRPGTPTVTTANGVHATPIGEFVFSMMLMWARQWPRILDLQRQGKWADRPTWSTLTGRELADATLGILGLGAIGRQVAHYGRAFGMRVLATRRSASGTSDPDVDEVIPAERLSELLQRSDYVVVSVPGTPATRHMIGAAQLAQMKPDAFLVNIARGQIVDTDALVAALQHGTIGGAGLDVTDPEPLPESSPLWHLPNVILSPHVSGVTGRYSERFTDLFLDNIRRYRAGEPLRNVVDAERGY